MKRGEVISIPIIVFNYQNEDIEAQVVLDNSLQEFEFVDTVGDITSGKRTKNVFYNYKVFNY